MTFRSILKQFVGDFDSIKFIEEDFFGVDDLG